MRLNNAGIFKYNLPYLLHPFDKETFLNTYYGKEFLHIPGPNDKFEDLVTYEDINELLQKFKLDTPNIRIIKEGQVVPRSLLVEDDLPSYYVTEKMPFLNNNAVAALLQSGHVMAIDDINQFINNLYLLRIALEWDLRERNRMNFYLGKEMSKGFGVHWDNHDVIVLQIYGQKTWNMYGFTEAYPLRPYNTQTNPPKDPVAQVEMTPGDVLYFPRGYWHATQADKDFSLHITIGVTRKTSLDYLEWLSSRLIKDPFFRKYLPVAGKADFNTDDYKEALANNLLTQINNNPPSAFLADVEANYAAPMLSSLPYSIDESYFTSDTLVKLNTFRPLAFTIDQKAASLSFTCHRKKWSFNLLLKEIFEVFNEGRFISLNQMWDRLQVKIDKETLTAVFTQSIKRGLLMVCEIK